MQGIYKDQGREFSQEVLAQATHIFFADQAGHRLVVSGREVRLGVRLALIVNVVQVGQNAGRPGGAAIYSVGSPLLLLR